MTTTKELSQQIAMYYTKKSSPTDKPRYQLMIWELSQNILKFELKKHKVFHLYDDTKQIYFEILKTHLNSFKPEKAPFEYWNRKAIQKAITKSIRFARSYRVYREDVDGKPKIRHEARPFCQVDENRVQSEDIQLLPDNTTKILKLFLEHGVLSNAECRLLLYKFVFKFTNIRISKIYKVSHTSVDKWISISLDKMRFYMIANPEKFGR